MLDINTKAPEFTLPDQNGDMVSLSSFKGKKVILYFYPKDSTPGCTKEACSFRDAKPELDNLGAVVLGVSKDSARAHRNFIEKQSLNFTLLSDESTEVIQAYGAWGEKNMCGKKSIGIIRSTFVIDEEGMIIKTYPKVAVATHGEDVRAFLESIK